MTRRRIVRNPANLDARKLGSRAVNTSGSWTRGPIDGKRMGTAIHTVIQSLLVAGIRQPSPEELLQAVYAHPLLELVATDQMRAHQDIHLAAAIYFGRFVRPGWQLVGVEVSFDDGRFDVVWRLPDGRIVIDEFKTDKKRLDTTAERAKIDRYRLGALAVYGDAFAYIRLLVLNDVAPGRSFRVTPDGGRWSLEEND
jgi:hypothetical protein